MKIEEKKNKKPNPYLKALVNTAVMFIVVMIMGLPQVLGLVFFFLILSLLCFGFDNALLATGIILSITFVFTFCWCYFQDVQFYKEINDNPIYNDKI